MPSGYYAQESRFVPRHDAKTEDDGFLVFYVFDESQLDENGECRQDAKSELWIIDAVHPTMVAAGMKGGSEAYEEFVVLPQGEHACEATLMLWIILPDGLSDDIVAAASASGLAQIEKEMRLMKEALEGRAGSS